MRYIFLLLTVGTCVMMSSILNVAGDGDDTPALWNKRVNVEKIRSHKGMAEESPGYVFKAMEIETEEEGNAHRYAQNPGKYERKENEQERKGLVGDFVYGTETFLDRIRARMRRYRRREIQRYR